MKYVCVRKPLSYWWVGGRRSVMNLWDEDMVLYQTREGGREGGGGDNIYWL